MTYNQTMLFGGCPPGTPHYYKLRLLDCYVLKVLEKHFRVIVTSGWRPQQTQDTLTYADGRPVPASVKAKGVSQHVLGEAFDFTEENMPACFVWCVKNLAYCQLIIYFEEGIAQSMHVSMLSERVPPVKRKTLVYSDGKAHHWTGHFPVPGGRT